MNLNNLKVQGYDGKLMDGKLMHLNDQLCLLNTRLIELLDNGLLNLYTYFPMGIKYFQLKQICVDIFKDNLCQCIVHDLFRVICY